MEQSGPMTPSATARAEIVVDLAAIRHNVRLLRDLVAPAQMMTVVKADGYGHGLLPSARAARQAGADWIGVATIDEALALRTDGDTGRVLCWLGVPGERYFDAIVADLDVTAYSVAELGEIAEAAEQAQQPARLQLKVDTGLSRGGATLADWPHVVELAAKMQERGLAELTGIWSHFACSDQPDHPANDAQEDAFRAALSTAEDAGLRPELRHLANSAAAILRPSSRFDLVRCGIASYGLDPAPGTTPDLGLVPAMTARATLALSQADRVPAPGSPTGTPGSPTTTPRSASCRWGTATGCRGTPATGPRPGSTAGGGRCAAGSAWTSSWSISTATCPRPAATSSCSAPAATASRPRRTGRRPARRSTTRS